MKKKLYEIVSDYRGIKNRDMYYVTSEHQAITNFYINHSSEYVIKEINLIIPGYKEIHN